MSQENILTPSELEICEKEKYYFQKIGINKDIEQIAIEHNFIQKKEQFKLYGLELVKKYEILISDEDAKNFYVECKELLGPKRLLELEEQLGKKVVQQTIPVREFKKKFSELLFVDSNSIEKRIKQFNSFDTDDNEVLSLFEMILSHGVRNGVSDIHINSFEEFSWLRYRTDGRIKAKYLLSQDLAQRFSLIIKEKTNIDLINIKTPQSGGFSEIFKKDKVDFRVEIAPSNFGEKIVIRILDKSNNFKSLEHLFPKTHPMGEYVNRYVNQKNGFFLTVGPTGSGKTTTLNSIINQRDRLHEIIYTIEDPIEYKIDFVAQYQVNEDIGFTFQSAIRSVMRQDPDVIVIGEMRDKDSILTALKAAHSGHMVFSTLHTTNSYMALERIRDEGGDLFILAYSLSGVIAQRLVPKLCDCKSSTIDQRGKNYFKSSKLGYEKKGCLKCDFTGYSGRVLLTDMVFIPNDMKTRYIFYMALKDSTVLKAWDKLITFSYYESAQYLFEHGLCDYEMLTLELFSLGYVDED